jgi:putative transposase
MFRIISALLAFVVSHCRSRASLCLEHLTLRHQLGVYQQTVDRPRLHWTDRVLWAWLSRLWPSWRGALVFVQPHTVIAWQQRFRHYWRRLSQQPRRSVHSSKACGRRIPRGVRLGSSENRTSLAST